MIAAPLVAVALLAAPAQPPAQPSAGIDPASAPPAFGPALKRGEEAIAALQQSLQARLGKAMADGGPAATVTVCRDEAAKAAAEVGKEKGVRIGRTSDRLRNPRNAPPAWAGATVAAAAGRKPAEVKPVAFDLGDRVGLLKPIAVAPACVRCHGKADGIPEEVRTTLRTAYPDDRAVGYEAGEHRGFFWVEAPK